VNALDTGCTIGGLVRESGLPRPEAELLLRVLLECERSYLITRAEETVDSTRAIAARGWFARRRAGEPVAYITGRREFYGLSLRITPEVLIPRPETERLVELALERLPRDSRMGVLELGTGSGAIALALARERPGLGITATDISESALEVARGNARSCDAEIHFAKSDWFEGLVPGRFDLVVSNPPYVAAGDAHLDQGDLRFEPRLALVGGDDGLACIRAIAARARDRIRSGGWLLLEHGYDQGDRCLALLGELGYADVEDFEDLAGIPRVCAGRRMN
jgi:release factor glutamine methyltransferase